MEKEIATKFKALGDPTRLRIYRFLCDCCCDVAVEESGDVRTVSGPTVGEVCCHITGVEHSSSNLSFHLKELRNAGLITMERRGKNIICGIETGTRETLVRFFGSMGKDRPECC